MDSTVTRSPPTSRAMDARSSVVVMTFSLPWACAIDAMSEIPIPTRHAADFMTVIYGAPQTLNRLPRTASERVRTMGSDREQKLKKKFIRQIADGVLRPTVL